MEVGKSDMKQHGEFPEPARAEPAIFTQNLSDEENLYSPQWQMRYLIIAFAYTHWSKQMSPFRKSSSYSGWPIRNKQFHFLGVGNHPISTISTLSGAVSDGLWSKSPNCQELSATIQYQIRTVEQNPPPPPNKLEGIPSFYLLNHYQSSL